MFSSLRVIAAAVFLVCAVSGARAVDKESAISGASLAVIAPTYLGNGSSGPQSFIRFFSGAGSAGTSSTFTVTVVGIPSGQTYGSSFSLSVPYLASIQLSIAQLVTRAGGTPGSFLSGDSSYAIYLQDSDAEAGYQHVVYNWTTSLFENLSSCGSLENEQMVSLHKNMILANVHTSVGPAKVGATFPSTIQIHNRNGTAATYTLNIYNAGSLSGTGSASSNSGKLTCQITGQSVQANSTLSIPFSTIESNSACRFDSDEDYADIVVSDQSGVSPNATLTHLAHVSQYGGDTNLTDVCAVNKIATQTVVAAPTTPTAYCGTATVAAYSYVPVTFTASIAPDGVIRATAVGQSGNLVIYAAATGTVNGTSFTLNGPNGSGSGTVQNGTISGSTFSTQTGTSTFSGSTANCY